MNCKICNKELKNFEEIANHLVKDHKYNAEDFYKLYNYSFETGVATCPICGKEFVMTKRQINSHEKGKSKAIGCCKKCSMRLFNILYGNPSTWEGVNEKKRQTYLKHFGVEHISKLPEIKARVNNNLEKTNLKKYGVKRPIQFKGSFEKMKKTNLEKYDSEYSISSNHAQEKAKKTNLEKYGFENAYQNPDIRKKAEDKVFEKYGVRHASQSSEVLDKTRKSNLERYGVEYFCQHENCNKANKFRISKGNKKFQKLLEINGIKSELEFIIENVGYDLKTENTLIEIDPYYTHNVTRGAFFGGKQKKTLPINYHKIKTSIAKEHGFKCIHIFDWDDKDKIVNLLKPRETVYARKCEVKELERKVVNEFLDEYHLQGSTKQFKYAYGLYYEDKLVQVMTFGKPRYNKNYEYELLRLCTITGLRVIGGANKLLSYFEKQVKPKSIISYCDLSKFNGDVYEKLGFKLVNQTEPSKHWYNFKTKRHITDNLLRQRGFDQLHKANFGKGTSNEQLMIEHGYVEIYDCGQLVFVKSK